MVSFGTLSFPLTIIFPKLEKKNCYKQKKKERKVKILKFFSYFNETYIRFELILKRT